ncbi:MAG: hypothetical protein ACREWG_11550 [Gammaproteobacteria bacterium]
MTAQSPSDCKCGNKKARDKHQALGLDELMIVNPGPMPERETYFLGQDGTLYQVQGLGEDGNRREAQRYLLGEDGTLYQVAGSGANASSGLGEPSTTGSGGGENGDSGRYFLGADGTLYELIR